MKGKGKSIPDKECPLQFPDLQPVDHPKLCPKYTSVVARSGEECVGIEELDAIQTDLETLLATAGKRLRLLEYEIQVLSDWQDKKDIKKPCVDKVEKIGEPSTPGKRGKGTEPLKPNKKLKDGSGKGIQPPTVLPPNRAKTKNINQSKTELDAVDSPIDAPKLPKNDAVNRFWASVEPYCAEIGNDDMKFLEEILRSHEDDVDYFNIPPLGRLYSERWAEEDLLEEQIDGAKITDRRRGSNHSSINSKDAFNLLRKVENSNGDSSPFGPLTQRLISALIEENIMTSADDYMNDISSCKDTVDDASTLSPRALAKQLNIGNPAHLEKRIKRELEEQGLLDFDDKVDDNPDDEILSELRTKQQELKALTQQNILTTKRLYKLGKEEMARQEIRKKLSSADAEVMDAYRKIQAARLKKKAPSKKEREQALKAIRERDVIMKILDT